MLATPSIKYGSISLLALLGMLVIVSVSPDTARGPLVGRMLELHLVLELFAIVIASMVVAVSWHTFDRRPDPAATTLMTGFTVVIACDLMHALTYEGMPPLLTESSTQQAIFFWLLGRTFEVLTLGAVALGLLLRGPRLVLLAIGLAVAGATVAFGSYALDLFPVTFVRGSGVTPFKAGYEYALMGLNASLAVLLWRRARRKNSRQYALLALSCLFMAFGGFAFTAYVTPSDFQNVVGHLYKVGAYACLYRATFMNSIEAPYVALQASEALVRESQTRIQTLCANLPNSVVYQVVLEADGHRRFTQVSDSAEHVCGLRVRDLVEDPQAICRWIHPDDMPMVVAEEQRCAKTLEVFDVEARFLRPDGAVRRMHLVSAPRRMTDGRIVWDGVLTDVTERTEAQEARRRLEQQLGEAQKLESIGTLASGIAHDFNNVLAAILGNAHMAREDLKDGRPADASLCLDQIVKAGDRARSLVDRILTFSRHNAPQRQVQRLLPIVHETLALLRSTLPAGVELVEIARDPDVCADVDRTQFEQILLNLCTNSWHALGEKGGRIEVRLDSRVVDAQVPGLTLPPGSYACLTVEDNGCGMPAQVMQRIFDPFFTTKPAGKGTGLGLSVVHGIVKEHGGSISVDTLPDRGTRIDICFPVPPGLTAAPAEPAEPVRAETGGGRGERVLLLEDDPLMSSMLEKLLLRHGYQVDFYNDPERAIAAVRADPQAFDLMVTDYNMPKLSGLDAISAIWQLSPAMPAVLISGYVSDELRTRAAAQGVVHVLEKPRSLEHLAKLLPQLLGQGEAERAAG